MADRELETLPDKFDEQLRLGIQTIQKAYRDKVEALERESDRLRQLVKDRQTEIAELRDAISGFRFELDQRDQQLQQAAEERSQLLAENQQLMADKQQLAQHVKKLSRDNAKLANFKKAIIKTLNSQEDTPFLDNGDTFSSLSVSDQNDESPLSPERNAESYYMSSSSSSISPQHLLRNSGKNKSDPAMRTASPSVSTTSVGQHLQQQQQQQQQQIQPTRSLSPREGDNDHNLGGAGGGGDINMSEGKEFFKQAKTSLNYEQFQSFLATIRKLNNNETSREETLRVVRDIFGPDKQALFQAFKNLLNKHTD